MRAVIELLEVSLSRESQRALGDEHRARSVDAAALANLLERVAARPFDYSVKRLAAELHVSSKTVERRFVAEGLGSPANWITAQRVLTVWAELECGSTGSATIARRLGLADGRPVRRILQLLGVRGVSATTHSLSRSTSLS